MAELFMECEEEELEPWQQKANPIVVDDDDDDDDEPIFVGEFLSSKPTNTYILNRVNTNSSRIGVQNGAPKRGAVAVSPGFHSSGRPATSTLAVQPQPRISSISGSSQVLQKPLSECSSPQEGAKPNAGISQPVNISAPTQSLSRNLHIPASAPSTSRPVATVTAQPIALNRVGLELPHVPAATVLQPVTPDRTSGLTFGVRQNSGGSQYQSGSPMNMAGLSKRPSASEASSIIPKKAKANETGSENESPLLSSVKPPDDLVHEKDAASSNIKNGAPFPQACPKCNIHFNLLEPLKNHIKYCCPDMVHAFPGITKMDCSGISPKIAEAEKGKLIMLVNDFYYGKHEGNLQQVHQEQKTHTTFKCASCMKVLKSNIRFMNHMKHHLELEKQNSESWESHTTCQHCYRQFPTPFQLQCHIESTHTPHESSTICKICELSFETEQVLLQHMKDNHKPGEMPYVCQVCNYRSSAFSDVEKHFRSIHENTKNLLCPFCLKVIKIGAPYMHHFMRHQKKGIHRCTKCRLQFLTCKEKLDHKSQHHRTFKKPAQLEGLPPGTKVTIRASAGSLQPASVTASPASTNTSTLLLSPGTKAANSKAQNKLTASCKGKTKLKPLNVQKKQVLGTSSCEGSKNSSGGSSSGSSGGGGGGGSSKKTKVANTALNNLRCPDIQKCIECYSDIRTFASHFPAYVRCSLCRYSTSCSKAYVNHMMGFHSARQTKRFWIYKTHSDELRGTTVVCLNCDFLTDVSGLDKMATHLNESLTHTCQVIVERVPLDCFTAADISGLAKDALLKNEIEEKSEKHLVPPICDEQGEACISESPQMKESVRETNADLPGKQNIDTVLAADSEGTKSPVPENGFSSTSEACSRSPARRGALGGLGNQQEESVPVSGCEGKPSPLEEDNPVSAPEPEACPGKSSATSPGKQMDEDLSDAQKEGPVLSAAATSELHSCSTGSRIKGSAHPESPSVIAAESKASLPVPEGACSSESIGSPSRVSLGEDCCPSQSDLGPLAAEHEGSTTAPESSSWLEFTANSSDSTGPDAARDADVLRNKTNVGLLVCRHERTEDAFALGESAHSDSSADLTGEGDEDRIEDGDKTVSLTAQCEGTISELVGDQSCIAELCTFSKDSLTGMVRVPLQNPAADEHEGSPSSSAVKNGITPGLQGNVLESSCEKTVFDKQGEAEPTELGSNKSSACSEWTGSDVQTKVASLEEAQLADVNMDSIPLASNDEEVSFEQFLRRRGEPDSAHSDASEQGSIHLEPLTPSEVLEHEATEILQQKGGVPASAKKTGLGSEPADLPSGGGSPSHVDLSSNQEEASNETS